MKLLILLKKLFAKPVFYIGGSEILPDKLSKKDEEQALILLSNGNEEVKNLLIEHNLRLVVYIARKFENTGLGIEDLISIGTIGLIKAVNTFKPNKNIKLATYASRCIENEILMYLRKNSKTKSTVSLYEPLNIDYDGNELLLCDILGTEKDVVSKEIENSTEKDLIINCIKDLPPREKEIMMLRYGLCGTKEKTQKQVADELSISQSYISRLEKRIIKRLKTRIEKII